MFDRLIVNYDDALHEREPLRLDLCGRCSLMLSAWLGNEATVLLLDRPTLEALASGVVNARAEVAAKKRIAELDAALSLRVKASA